MRLKHLELQGYKTFASRTQFAFDDGITAIVGPNGSGKSNIADAIRWVLGEQSFSTLRGKRTEDMIFSGSSHRPRLGMASASLVLDNADGWLPIDFAEVTVTRRAYRSGENEYVLNGSRVRLRDITELLAKSGLAQRTYTVIGQGLVDAVLSLRADDRRALFEEAAGIALYRSKRSDALSRLDETRSNLIRVNDIINEIAPRLRRLEGQAERAVVHKKLEQQLEGLQRTWYGYRWRQAQLAVQRAQDSISRRETRLMRRRVALDSLDERMAVLRIRLSELRDQLGDWHRETVDLHRQMEVVQRDLAVQQERARLLARQGNELEAEVTGLETQAQVLDDQMGTVRAEVVACEADLRNGEALVGQAQEELDTYEAKRSALSEQMTEGQARVFDLATQDADLRNRLAQLAKRRSGLERERAEVQTAISTQEGRASDLQAQTLAVTDGLVRLEEEGRRLAAEGALMSSRLATEEARDAELRGSMADAKLSIDQLQARYELLAQMREGGEGMRGGVRAVLEASRLRQPSGQDLQKRSRTSDTAGPVALVGIRGTVAQLILVSAEYEIAVEAALGGHVQDVVVETWPDAEAAIAFLRTGKRGRATFLPLDTIRPASRPEVPLHRGVIGIAADLVEADSQVNEVVEVLLGRTIVVQDLETARRTLDRLRGGFQIVTLSGEILRSSGSVTGGQGTGRQWGQTLAREREWRELPVQITAARARQSSMQNELAKAQEAAERARQDLASFESEQRELQASKLEAQAQGRELERELARVSETIDWRRGLLAQLDAEKRELGAQESSFRDELARLAAQQVAVENEVAALQARLELLRGESLYQRLSEARTEAAVARGAWEHRRATLEALRERQADHRLQLEAKQRRAASFQQEQSELADQTRRLASREAVIRRWLAALTSKIEPAEAEVAGLEAEREQMASDETHLRTRLREAENSHAQALLAQSRHQDRLQRLRRQIMDDFGLVEIEPAVGLAEQLPLPLAEMVSSLPLVKALPEGLEEEIHQIKAQMRRVGYVNLNAPEEYAEALERHEFLTSQASDLEEATQRLGQVVADLDEVMRQEFLVMFEAVSRRFKENFVRLFGGGAAHLQLTEPDDVSQTGVEIVARPPGKRQQALALLSGGERSLTAVALIFALLETNLPPFCILDEVDAMLDEANVRRFRQKLEELALQTQFIIITHNRATITAADTIYGVSMGEDSVSQVISLRLDGDRIAAPTSPPTANPA